ncbi:MAG: ornithine carbamoyltransferase [Acidimicrobiia bacterium]|nr:ornithine carbamoyltransferase [Acidimicrobiia bacterium]
MDFLSAGDPGPDGLADLLDRARAAKADPGALGGRLEGRTVGLFFEKPSLRTRVSSEVAALRLGARPVTLKQDEVGFGSREAVRDVARVLDRYVDLVAMRVFRHGDLLEVAEHAGAPVVNLLSDLEHPCQALADLQTLQEARPLEGAVLAYVGDGNNVCHSLLLGGPPLGVTVRVAHPAGHAPDAAVVERARRAAAPGAEVVVGEDVEAAVRGADAVYTDVWASMGQEAEAAERRLVFEPYRVDERVFGLAGGDAIFLHCLPAHRGDEVTDAVMDHERSRVFDQAENRLHAFVAVLDRLLG